MKHCACCGAMAAAAEPTCAQCGEASWIESREGDAPTIDKPAAEPKKRGR